MSKKKSRISSDDFLNMMDEEEVFHASYVTQKSHEVTPPKMGSFYEHPLDSNTGDHCPDNLEKKRNNCGNNLEKIRENSGNNMPAIRKKSVSKSGIKHGNESGVNPEVTRKKTGNLNPDFQSITGIQRSLVLYLYNQVLQTPDKKTPPISLKTLGEVTNKTSTKALESLRKNLAALISKGIILREFHKAGPGGFTIYSLNEKTFLQIRDFETWKNTGNIKEINRQNTGNRPGNRPGNTPSYSNSNQLNNNTNTETLELPPEWESLVVPQIVSRSLGLGRPQINSLFKKHNLSPEDLQESIWNAEHDLLNGKKVSASIFYGVLNKGNTYNSPDRLASLEQELSLQRELEQKKITITHELTKKASQEDLIKKYGDEAKRRLEAMSEGEQVKKYPSMRTLPTLPEPIKSSVYQDILFKVCSEIDAENQRSKDY